MKITPDKISTFDYLKNMMESKKYFEKIKINNLYKYECIINPANKINIYTSNNNLNIKYIDNKIFLKLFLKCIQYKYKNDDDIMEIYEDMFYSHVIPKKINTKFGELLKKYIIYDEKEVEQTNIELSNIIEKFLSKILFNGKINKISSRYELYYNNILFDMCLRSIYDKIYIMEFIIFGKTILSIITTE